MFHYQLGGFSWLEYFYVLNSFILTPRFHGQHIFCIVLQPSSYVVKISFRTVFCYNKCFNVTILTVLSTFHGCYTNANFASCLPNHLCEVPDRFSISTTSCLITVIMNLFVPGKGHVYYTVKFPSTFSNTKKSWEYKLRFRATSRYTAWNFVNSFSYLLYISF